MAIWRYYQAGVDSEDERQRIQAHKMLLRYSSWLDADARVEYSDELLRFFKQHRPSLDAWKADHMRRVGSSVVSFSSRNHRGEWIPWEDDALSAAFSWSSQLHLELSSLPLNEDPAMGVFRHLMASGSHFDLLEWGTPEFYQIDLDQIAPTSAFSDPVPSPPFTETPWQRARALHLRRPDLEFPARPIFRPSGDRVRLRSEVEILEY